MIDRSERWDRKRRETGTGYTEARGGIDRGERWDRQRRDVG